MPRQETADAATLAYRQLLTQFQSSTSDALSTVWLGLDSYDRDVMERWGRAIVPLVTAAADESAAAAAAYVAIVTETPIASLPRQPVIADTGQPFHAMWRRMEGGELWETARHTALGAVGSLANEIVHGAARFATGAAGMGAGSKIIGWRRLPGGVSCEWCFLVAGQKYRTADSADFGHRKCDCTVAPITASVDPRPEGNQDVRSELNRQGVGVRERMGPSEHAKIETARRDRAVDELKAETDPARRERLKDRAIRHERAAEAFRASAATPRRQFPRSEIRGKPRTGYTDASGTPIPHP